MQNLHVTHAQSMLCMPENAHPQALSLSMQQSHTCLHGGLKRFLGILA